MNERRAWRGYLKANESKPQVNKSLLKRVGAYAKPYRRWIFGSLIAILFNTLLGLVSPLILRTLIDQAIPEENIRLLILCAIGIMIIPILSGACQVLERSFSSRTGEGVIFDLRVALFDHLQRMSLRFFTHTQVGELLSRLNNDVVDAQNAINRTLVGMVTNLITVVSSLIVMATLEWRLTLISAAIVPLFIIAARRLGGVFRKIARQQMEENARMNAMLGETLNIGGALLIKLFGRQNDELTRFSTRANEVRRLGVKRSMLARTFVVLIGLLSAVGMSLVYGVGGYMVILKVFTLGTIIAFGSYLTQLYSSFQGLVNAPVEFSSSLVSFERVFEVIDLPLDIDEPQQPITPEVIHGNLEFEHVTFKYTNPKEGLLHDVQRAYSEDQAMEGLIQENQNGFDISALTTSSQARELALMDIDFSVQAGQLIALVGPSGSGKTTLTYLIPRLYDPTEGRILLDGTDLRKLSLKSLSDTIGMVTQEPYLFHDTILSNMLYANPHATPEMVEQAARTANIHPFISGLPEGYQTIVGERGYRLSGGEKQRLALARVLLKNPRILILDEATSHLDSESEALIQEAMARILTERTSIVIAHRLSTILSADLILVLNRGRIVERGTHPELLSLNGLYAQLYETQFKSQNHDHANGHNQEMNND